MWRYLSSNLDWKIPFFSFHFVFIKTTIKHATEFMDQRPSRVDFDDAVQTTTKKTRKGATLVCQNRALPSGAEFGVNLKSFRVPREVETFRGVEMLPAGRVHLAFVGGGGGARVGEFVLAEKDGEVETRTWDEKNERFYNRREAARIDDEEKEYTKQKVILGVKRGDFDECLGAYEEDSREDARWKRLTNRIDVNCLKRCKIEPGVMFVPGGVDRCLDAFGRKKRLTREVEDDAKNRNEEEDENTRAAKFTFDATTRAPRDADAAILTKIHVDGRFRFERAMNVFGENREAMLAEHQLAYVLFFAFGCGKGLEQWKELTVIMANVMAEYIKEDVEKKTSNDQSVKNRNDDWSSFFVGFLGSLEGQFNDDATNEGTLDEVVSETFPTTSRDEKQLSDILRDAISKSYRIVSSSSFPRDDDAMFGWLVRFETIAKRLLQLKIFQVRTGNNCMQEENGAYTSLIIDHDAETEDEQPLIVELPEGKYAHMDKDDDDIEVVEADDTNININNIDNNKTRMSWMV